MAVDADDPTPKERPVERPACDLVMKGGITSGVVYPKLIARLSEKYRFHNIGGSSAGAIAAAACAAAEYGRQHGVPDAFARLSHLPQELGQTRGKPATSKLSRLFQPAPPLRRHFAVLLSMLNRGPWQAAGHAVLMTLRQFWVATIAAVLLSLLLLMPVVRMAVPTLTFAPVAFAASVLALAWALGAWLGLRGVGRLWWGAIVEWAITGAAITGLLLLAFGAPFTWSWLLATAGTTLAALLVLAVVIIAAAAVFAITLISGLHRNFYGLCSGRTARPGDPADDTGPGLTDWLAGYLNELAGLPGDGPPLSFGQLWGDAAGDDPAAPHGIHLEVMTTAVSQQMCYTVPLRDGSPTLYFDEAEWQRLFPPVVMRALMNAPPNNNDDGDGHTATQVISTAGRLLRRLPDNAHLPVVVAVRMSLGFPILLSALPLYAVDWSLVRNMETKIPAPPGESTLPRRATRVWFSDGGICSNIPLHMFDMPLPGHPTFAVNLKPPHPDRPIEAGGRLYLPANNTAGRIRHWAEPDDSRPTRGLIAFLRSIVFTMQNWRDEIQFPYPGLRDRIVQISQRPDEGGLNLDMPKDHITALSDAGEAAAQLLIDRFHPEGAGHGEGWANHRQVRLTTYLGLLETMGLTIGARLAGGRWEEVNQAVVRSGRYTLADGQFATDYLDRLQALGERVTSSGAKLRDKALKPVAELRVVPRI
jgi:predicted acylesterase/phospholipase RssA